MLGTGWYLDGGQAYVWLAADTNVDTKSWFSILLIDEERDTLFDDSSFEDFDGGTSDYGKQHRLKATAGQDKLYRIEARFETNDTPGNNRYLDVMDVPQVYTAGTQTNPPART